MTHSSLLLTPTYLVRPFLIAGAGSEAAAACVLDAGAEPVAAAHGEALLGQRVSADAGVELAFAVGWLEEVLDLLEFDDPRRVGDALDVDNVVVAYLPEEEEQDDLIPLIKNGTYLEEKLNVIEQQRNEDDVCFQTALEPGGLACSILQTEEPDQVIDNG